MKLISNVHEVFKMTTFTHNNIKLTKKLNKKKSLNIIFKKKYFGVSYVWLG